MTPTPASPEFGWDNARTHRVEAIPGGGVLINLNDRCVIVLEPFPFPFCRIGKIAVNGDLFKHLHAPKSAGDWNLP